MIPTPAQLARLLIADERAHRYLKLTYRQLDRHASSDRGLCQRRALRLLSCNVRDAVRLAGGGVPHNVQNRTAQLLLHAWRNGGTKRTDTQTE